MPNFTQEQLEAAKAAKSPEELVRMAKDAGIEITQEQAAAFLNPPVGEMSDEELENVAGGGCLYEPDFVKCPKCRSENLIISFMEIEIAYECKSCGHKW